MNSSFLSEKLDCKASSKQVLSSDRIPSMCASMCDSAIESASDASNGHEDSRGLCGNIQVREAVLFSLSLAYTTKICPKSFKLSAAVQTTCCLNT